MATDDRLRCFLLGTEVGDALEDLQQQTEDLLEEVAVGTHASEEFQVDSCLVGTAADIYDMLIGPAGTDCGFNEAEVNLGVLSKLRGGRVRREEVLDVRRDVDKITMYFAAKANQVGLGKG